MKEPIIEKIKKLLHGTFLFPHNWKNYMDAEGYGQFCTCGKIRENKYKNNLSA